MAFILDKQELKEGLIIFRRDDVKHKEWYCRIKIPDVDKYKTIHLKTVDVDKAKTAAFEREFEMRVKIKHDLPIFDKPFRQVAKEYEDFQKQRADAGEIKHNRWKVVVSYIKILNLYCGDDQISLIGEAKWKGYPLWRRSEGKGRAKNEKVSDWTIRGEINVLRGIMSFAAAKNYVAEKKFSIRPLKLRKPRGVAFMPEEYNTLYKYARDIWIPEKNERDKKKKPSKKSRWYRKVFYNFMLIMANTGMRTPEAANLLRRDRGEPRTGKDGGQFLPLSVRGKDMSRELVAGMNVAKYLDRIYELMDQRLKELGRTATRDDHIFLTWEGKPSKTLYQSSLADLLSKHHTNLLFSVEGKRRSNYSFRHTYATFRKLNGTKSFELAMQMGTSEKEIRETYAHITPSASAAAILQGIPAWEVAEDGSGEIACGVNADAAGAEAKPRKAKRKGKALQPAGKASRSTRRR
ncbi:MAG: Site-specific recombinase, phage integrase family [Bryobacterales bacterium]|nr:Site-specific recombinase, phage integrase family [Bryobacterales bacterium]